MSYSLLAVPVLAIALASAARADVAPLSIQASVPARASVQVRGAPGFLEISAEDVERGYVDAAVPVALSVRTNSLRGTQLVFTGLSEFILGTSVDGMTGHVQLASAGGAVLLPAAARPNEASTLTLRLRFFLSRATPPGMHAWPLHIGALPA